MKMNIYSIYDTASGLYSRPFFCQSDQEALRSFSDISTDAEHPIGKHPEDYSLFRIGIFNDSNGNLQNEDNDNLAQALELVSAVRNVNRDKLETLNQTIANENTDPRNTNSGNRL